MINHVIQNSLSRETAKIYDVSKKIFIEEREVNVLLIAVYRPNHFLWQVKSKDINGNENGYLAMDVMDKTFNKTYNSQL